MKTKLSNKDIALGALTSFLGVILLLVSMFLMLVLINGADVISFIVTNVRGIVTVSICVCILGALTYAYFLFENKNVASSPKKLFEIYCLIIVSFVLCFVLGRYVDQTARPLILFAMLAAMLMARRRDALFINMVYLLILFLFNRYAFSSDMDTVFGVTLVESFASVLTVFCGGIIAIFVTKKIKTRIGSVMMAFVLLIPVEIINLMMNIPMLDPITWEATWEIMLFSALDCVLSVLLFMFLLPVFETVFSELTPFRLRELTSDSAKLIKRLRTNALGTYNHSIVVAQMAEACASAIGEDAELARAAAYYHDMGKLKNPEMFAENQSDYNLHRELTPELSVDIIRAHARDGAKLIKKNHLPEFFATVAVEHHGTLPIKYFYAKALKMSDGELNAGNYSYSGPTPTNKISAIIMLADSSEAAARSLTDRSPEKVEALVRNLIEERMNLDQFVDCDITMRELTVITRTIVTSLTGVYHSRVQYPKLVLSKKK